MLYVRYFYTLIFFALLLLSKTSIAYDQPAVNLGFTSFLDGAPPAGPGWYFSQYLSYYESDQFTDSSGNGLPVSPDLDGWISLTQVIYQSNQELLFGGKWGVTGILPYVDLDTNPSIDNMPGFGDILIGPYLQWDPIMGENGPVFMHRVEFSFIFPTGEYDNKYPLNPSSNHFSFNPYWAATLFINPKLTASWRLHYLWNGENDDPNVPIPGLNDYQPGQSVHLNYTLAYEIIPKQLRLGLNGYYLKQISDSEADGSNVSGREQVFAIGPGLVWHLSKDAHLFFNWYEETNAKNRPEGSKLLTRFVYHF